MQRDMDLARLILLEIARRADTNSPQEIVIDGHSRRKISVHIMLLAKGGLIEAEDMSTRGILDWIPTRPTDAGFEFLDTSSDEDVWKTAKSMIVEMGGSFSFDILRQLLVKLTAAIVVES